MDNIKRTAEPTVDATEMFAIFREIKTPGFTYDSFVVSPITSDTPDSPDEVPGTRHWIEAVVQLECDRRNAEVRRDERRARQAEKEESERLRVEKGVLLGEPPTASYWQWLASQV